MTKEQLYGHGACADTPDSACYDMDRSTSASGVAVPAMPFQNRPTFQQTVELTQRLRR